MKKKIAQFFVCLFFIAGSVNADNLYSEYYKGLPFLARSGNYLSGGMAVDIGNYRSISGADIFADCIEYATPNYCFPANLFDLIQTCDGEICQYLFTKIYFSRYSTGNNRT